MDKLNHNNSGFSTLEILIALSVMLAVISTVILVSFGNQNLLVGGQTNSEAMQEAQKLLESAQALARKDFRVVQETPATTSDDGFYTKWTDVEISKSSQNLLTKKITAHVEWTDDSLIKKHIEMSTLVTDFENAVGGDTCDSTLTGNWKNPIVKNFSLGNLIGDPSGSYPITDLAVYKKKMFVTMRESSQSVGPKSGGLGIDGAESGTLVWNNPNNTNASDNLYATNTINNTEQTHLLKITNFGFNLPPGATILGIKVEIERNRGSTGTGNVFDKEIKIVKPDGTFGITNKADTISPWPKNDTVASYGNSSDLWGEQWSVSEINNQNFGVALSATGSAGASRTVSVDQIRITITYIKEFYILDLDNPAQPTFISGLESNSTLTTGYNAVTTDGHFVYIATNSAPTNGQLQILDPSVNPPKIISTFVVPNVTGANTQSLGNSIFYKNGYIYLGLTKTSSGPEFNIIDVRNPFSPGLVGSYDIGSAVNKIYVRNQTAYLTTSDNAREIITLDISDPKNSALKNSYNALPDQIGFGFGRSLYILGDTWYLGRTYSSTIPEFSVIDASSTNPIPLANKDIGPNNSSPFSLNEILVRDSLAFLLLGSATKGGQLQILNATSTLPYTVPITWPNNNTGVGGSALDCEGNYVYLGSVDSSNNGYITVITGS